VPLPRCTSAELYHIKHATEQIAQEIDAEILRKQRRKGNWITQPN
jgi:hypothetical protein